MSSIRLFILDSFARHGEMHGHQLRLLAELEHVHLWTDITVGSIYGAMKRLASEGLLDEVRTEREGNRPERQIFVITDRGRSALTQLRTDGITELAIKPDPFDLALARLDPDRLGALPALLGGRLAALNTLLHQTRASNAEAEPYLSLVEKRVLQHREHRLRAELEWHESLLTAWPDIVADESDRSTAGDQDPPYT